MSQTWEVREGDALKVMRSMPDASVDCCVTSPPYWGLRDYMHPEQHGLEPTFAEWLETQVRVFDEVRRVLSPTGTLWVNMGDAYASDRGGGAHGLNSALASRKAAKAGARRPTGLLTTRSGGPPPACKPKDLIGQPWRLAFALQEAGWWLRSDVVWAKSNVTPETVQDRPCRAHEYVFLLAPSRRYYFDWRAIGTAPRPKTHTVRTSPVRTKGSELENKLASNRGERMNAAAARRGDRSAPDIVRPRTVWRLASTRYGGAHFATFPLELPSRCIRAGCKPNGVVLDPYTGSGTTAIAALREGRSFVGAELNPNYVAQARTRIRLDAPLFNPHMEVVTP